MSQIPTKNKEHNIELYEAILQLKTPDECFNFFHDLCSITELFAIEQRFEVAKMLKSGSVYNTISEKTRASSATISRVNRVLNYGTGALNELLERKNNLPERIDNK